MKLRRAFLYWFITACCHAQHCGIYAASVIHSQCYTLCPNKWDSCSVEYLVQLLLSCKSITMKLMDLPIRHIHNLPPSLPAYGYSQRLHWRHYSGYCTLPLELSWTSDHATMCLPPCENCTGCRSSRGSSSSCACSSTSYSLVIHKWPANVCCRYYVVFLSVVWVALKRTSFDVSELALSWSCGWITVGVQSDVPLPLHMHAAIFATGFVDDPLKNTVPSVNEPVSARRCRVLVLCNVR